MRRATKSRRACRAAACSRSSAARIGDQVEQRAPQRARRRPVGTKRAASPQSSTRLGMSAQHQGAAGGGGLQDREAERLVARRCGEDRGLGHARRRSSPRGSRPRYRTGPSRRRPRGGSPATSTGQGSAGCGRGERRHVLGLVPEPAGGQDHRPALAGRRAARGRARCGSRGRAASGPRRRGSRRGTPRWAPPRRRRRRARPARRRRRPPSRSGMLLAAAGPPPGARRRNAPRPRPAPRTRPRPRESRCSGRGRAGTRRPAPAAAAACAGVSGPARSCHSSSRPRDDQAEPGIAVGLGALRRVRRRADTASRTSMPCAAQAARQLQRVGPDAADRVGGHQHPRGGVTRAAPASSSASGRGRASCSSLKPAKVPR